MGWWLETVALPRAFTEPTPRPGARPPKPPKPSRPPLLLHARPKPRGLTPEEEEEAIREEEARRRLAGGLGLLPPGRGILPITQVTRAPFQAARDVGRLGLFAGREFARGRNPFAELGTQAYRGPEPTSVAGAIAMGFVTPPRPEDYGGLLGALMFAPGVSGMARFGAGFEALETLGRGVRPTLTAAQIAAQRARAGVQETLAPRLGAMEFYTPLEVAGAAGKAPLSFKVGDRVLVTPQGETTAIAGRVKGSYYSPFFNKPAWEVALDDGRTLSSGYTMQHLEETVAPIVRPKGIAAGFDQQVRKQIQEIKAKRFKSAGDEISLERAERTLASRPERWQVGQGVGWKPTGKGSGKGGQVNRGYRIEEVLPETKEAIIRPVGDIGQLADYTGRPERVDIIDLIRDKKYDMPPAVPKVAARAAPEAAAAKVPGGGLEGLPLSPEAETYYRNMPAVERPAEMERVRRSYILSAKEKADRLKILEVSPAPEAAAARVPGGMPGVADTLATKVNQWRETQKAWEDAFEAAVERLPKRMSVEAKALKAGNDPLVKAAEVARRAASDAVRPELIALAQSQKVPAARTLAVKGLLPELEKRGVVFEVAPEAAAAKVALTPTQAMRKVEVTEAFGLKVGDQFTSVPQGPGLKARPISGTVESLRVAHFTDGTPNPTLSEIVYRDKGGKQRTMGVGQVQVAEPAAARGGLEPAVPAGQARAPQVPPISAREAQLTAEIKVLKEKLEVWDKRNAFGGLSEANEARAMADHNALVAKEEALANLRAGATAPTAPAEVARPPVTPPAAPPVSGAVPPPRPPAPPTRPPAAGGPPAAPSPRAPGVGQTLRVAAAQVERDAPGTATRILTYIPGAKQIVQRLVPALVLPKRITAAWVGKGLAIGEVETGLQQARIGQERALNAVFGKGATTTEGFRPSGVAFLGTAEQAKYPAVGTLADILERPALYDMTPTQRALISGVQEARSTGFEAAKTAFGLEVEQFPVQPGGMHLAHVDVSDDAVKVSGSIEAALRRGRTKERFYPTSADRWAHDPTFKPETTVSRLLAADDGALAQLSGRNVFMEGTGGKTRLEVLQETHPELAGKMDALKAKLQSVRGARQRLGVKQTEALDDFLASPLEDADLTALQADLRPTVGADAVGRRGPNFGKDLKALNAEEKAVMGKLAELRPAWRTANTKPYAFVQEGVFRYFPAEEAQQVRNLLKISDSPVLRFIDNLRQTAFGGDLSPTTIQGIIAWASDPVGASRALVQGHYVLTQEGLLKLMAKDPEGWRLFTRATGINPLGGVQLEFAIGFPGRIPKVGKIWTAFNEAMYRPVTSAQKDVFQSSYQGALRRGLTQEQAMAIAGDDATKIIPRISSRRLGQSEAQAAQQRAVLTSVSFLTQPVALMNDATKGLVKLGLKQTITPTEAFAVRRVMTLVGTIEAISVLSNVYHARTHDLDVEQAIKDSLDPGSGKFMSFVLPDGSKIGLGGPFRSIIRAVAPADVPGIPVPVPFAGLPQWARGKVGPALGIAYDTIRNKDFYDREIRTGDFPLNVVQGLEYAAEGSLPLTVGTAAQEARQGASLKQIGQQVVSQFMGTNLSPQSVRDVRNAVAWEKYERHYSDLTPEQKGRVEEDARVLDRRVDDARQKGPRNPVARAFELRKEKTAQQLADDVLFKAKKLTPDEWRENRATRRADVASRSDELFRNVSFPKQKRTVLDDYYDRIAEVKADHNGVLTAEAWDKVDTWTQGLPLQDQAFIEENTGVGPATPMEKEYRALQKRLDATNYWDPWKGTYIRLTPEQRASYESYLEAKRTDEQTWVRVEGEWKRPTTAREAWLRAGTAGTGTARGDWAWAQDMDKAVDILKKRIRSKNPDINDGLRKFYGLKPLPQETGDVIIAPGEVGEPKRQDTQADTERLQLNARGLTREQVMSLVVEERKKAAPEDIEDWKYSARKLEGYPGGGDEENYINHELFERALFHKFGVSFPQAHNLTQRIFYSGSDVDLQTEVRAAEK